jgi:hypothetical protein
MKKNDPLIIVLATLLTASLIFVTWAEIGISTWIVSHSGVEDLMKKDGEEMLLFLKDGFWFLGRGLLLAEAVFGGTLLWVLWGRLYRSPK